MGKRGTSHIDWVISIGIFIVYVLLLLVWIKPGYEPVFEQDTLVSIVKNNIEKDHDVEVLKTLVVAHRPNGDIEIYGTGKNEYWVISSEDFSYDSNPGPLETLAPLDCTGVSIGENVAKKGLSGFSLPGFNPSNWGFPSSREFKIILTNFGGSDVCYSKMGSVNCDSFESDSNVPVYSNEWRYNVVVNENGDLEPVLITILIW